MSETFARPEHAPVWVAAMQGRAPDWATFLDGYAAGVDAPFSNCWRELASIYPDAPVLLSRRQDADSWYRSMDATVLPRARQLLAGDEDDPMVPLFRVMFGQLFNDINNRADVIAGYERRLAEVRAEIDPARLIEWQPADGWEPICTALGAPIPDHPFPHRNSTAEYADRSKARSCKDQERLAIVRSASREGQR